MVTMQCPPTTDTFKPGPPPVCREYRAPNVPDYLKLPTATQAGALSTFGTSVLGSNANDFVARGQRLVRFMAELNQSGEVDKHALKRAQDTLVILRLEFRGLPIPHASAGEGGKFMFFWDISEHHFELEFLSNGKIEAFYENMKTGALWGEEYSDICILSSEAKEYIQFLL